MRKITFSIPEFYGWPTHLLVGGLLCLLLAGCRSDDQVEPLPAPDDPYAFVAPANFPPATYTFDNNPVSEAGFRLGKRLFFDPILSLDNTVSCNSCHNQSLAFADFPLHPVSIGVGGATGTRNAPQLVNLAFRREFFWDGGATHLDFVPLNAIENPVEMQEEIGRVIDKLNADPEYSGLFGEVFGQNRINTPQLLHALSQFMALMISNQSLYDQHLAGEYSLEPAEARGLALFETHCQGCHSGILLTDESYRNNGLDSSFTDVGRELITAYEGDRGKFMVPSLRNVALTSPYMHNARFNSLQAVLDHYSDGMVDSPSLDPTFRREDGRLGIPLSETEKSDLIAFLKTLTDRNFTNNPLFFKEQ